MVKTGLGNERNIMENTVLDISRRAHNPEVVGSNPTPATKELK